jgi:hypothetical protein
MLPGLLIAGSILAQPPQKLRIDPANAAGAPVSQVFEEVNIIPLETSKKSLFGQIDGLLVTEKYFIIFDNSTHCIFLFGKKGEFHAKIEPRDGIILPFFSYEKEKDRLLVFFLKQTSIPPQEFATAQHDPFNAMKLFNKYVEGWYFNMDGQFLSKMATPVKIDDFTAVRLPGDEMLSCSFLADKRMPDSTGYQLIQWKNRTVEHGWFPYNTKTDIALCGRMAGAGALSEAENENSLYFTRPFDYTVYSFLNGNITPRFQFVFPLSNSIPEKYLTTTFKDDHEIETFLTNYPDAIKTISAIYPFGNTLFFKLNTINDFFIYGLETGSLLSLNKLSPDAGVYWLPLMGDAYNIRDIAAKKGSYIYLAVSSVDMFNAKEIADKKHAVYPQILENYFKTQTRKSNSVIIQLKPRKNIE